MHPLTDYIALAAIVVAVIANIAGVLAFLGLLLLIAQKVLRRLHVYDV